MEKMRGRGRGGGGLYKRKIGKRDSGTVQNGKDEGEGGCINGK